MTTSIDDLMPDVRTKAWAFVVALKLKGIPHVVTSTLRTTDEQVALYAQGRQALAEVNTLRARANMHAIGPSENGYTVTNCDGIVHKSNHQGGRALDIVPMNHMGYAIWPSSTDPRWLQIATEGEAVGFSWGGRWKAPDLPHYEMA